MTENGGVTMEIRPTLFIGLGTSGVDIIAQFRRLMYEQFTRAGLPSFQYLGIETNGEAPSPDEEYSMDEFGRITFLRTTVSNMAGIKVKLHPGGEDDMPDLKRWLSPDLLIDENAVEKGANHIRMLGRLAMWMNWNDIKLALMDKHTALRDTARKRQTEHILRERLPGQEPPAKVSPDGYDIFILGTLCGGTCGGMLIDMAYQVQELFGIGNAFSHGSSAPNIYAVVTVLDSELARVASRSRQSANCWASLMELDYYLDDRTEYDYTMPDSADFKVTRKPPVTFVQLVSRTNYANEVFKGPIDGFKGDEINLMVAMKVFNNIFTGLDRDIAAEMVNRIADGSQARNKHDRTRTMTSFGVSVLRNPKYRFAEEFACDRSIELCERLLGKWDPGRESLVSRLAHEEWRRVVRASAQHLTHPTAQEGIDARIDELTKELPKKAESVNIRHLGAFLNNYPADEPLAGKFKRNGEYYKEMNNMVDTFQRDLERSLEALLDKLMAAVDPLDEDIHAEQIRNVSEIAVFMEKVKDTAAQDAAKGDEHPPPFNFTHRPVPQGADLLGSWWLKALFLGSGSVEKIRSKIIEEYRAYVKQFLGRCVMHIAREPILRIVGSYMDTLEEKVSSVSSTLTDTIRKVAQEKKKAHESGSHESHNIWEIAEPGFAQRLADQYDRYEMNGKRTIMQEILKNLGDEDSGTRGKSWGNLLVREVEDVAGITKYPYFRWALEQRNEWNVAQEALREFKGQEEMGRVVRRSFPYIQMKSDYHSIRPSINVGLERVCGKSIPGAMVDQANDNVDKGNSFRQSPSSLDNVVVFYRQEAPFHMDDMAAADQMQLQYTKYMQPGVKPLHTDIDPSVFDKAPLEFLGIVQDKLDAVQYLYPDEVFDQVGNKLVFRYAKKGGRREQIIVTTDEDKDSFCMRLARKDDQGLIARAEFDKRVGAVLREHGFEDVSERADALEDEWLATLSNEKATSEKAKLDKLIQEVFPEELSGGDTARLRSQ
jgi:hypothetical protein